MDGPPNFANNITMIRVKTQIAVTICPTNEETVNSRLHYIFSTKVKLFIIMPSMVIWILKGLKGKLKVTAANLNWFDT